MPVSVLRYMYCGEVTLDPGSAMYVLKASRKFRFPLLTAQCLRFIESCVSADVVCTILQQATSLGEQDIVYRCLQYIACQPAAVFKSAAFLQIQVTNLLARLV